MNRRSRRKRTTEERLTPCECCGYPVSQAHHLLPVNKFGDLRNGSIDGLRECAVSICWNCHEFYHLLADYFDGHISEHRRVLFIALVQEHALRYDFLLNLHKRSQELRTILLDWSLEIEDHDCYDRIVTGEPISAVFLLARLILKRRPEGRVYESGGLLMVTDEKENRIAYK